MPYTQYTPKQVVDHMALIDNKLAYTLDELKITNNMQAHLAANGVHSLGRLVHLADDIAGVRQALIDLLSMDPAILAERKQV